MKDPLLPIGSVLFANIGDDNPKLMVIGHRIINYKSLRAWDYVAVDYPIGLERYFKSDNTFDCDQFYYFNHHDITKILYKMEVHLDDAAE